MERIVEKTKNSRMVSLHILTKREIKYLTLAALGCVNTEITTKLVVSRSTVKILQKMFFRKLKARNRTHAVSMAFSLGILTTQLLTDMKNSFKVDGWNLYDISEEDKI